MSRSDADALDDIAAAITSIRSHLQHGPISVEIVMDAVAMRLLEIGEAVKALSTETTDTEPEIRWREIAGMRDFLAHHYFATNPELVQAVIDQDLPPLAEAVERICGVAADRPGRERVILTDQLGDRRCGQPGTHVDQTRRGRAGLLRAARHQQ